MIDIFHIMFAIFSATLSEFVIYPSGAKRDGFNALNLLRREQKLEYRNVPILLIFKNGNNYSLKNPLQLVTLNSLVVQSSWKSRLTQDFYNPWYYSKLWFLNAFMNFTSDQHNKHTYMWLLKLENNWNQITWHNLDHCIILRLFENLKMQYMSLIACDTTYVYIPN